MTWKARDIVLNVAAAAVLILLPLLAKRLPAGAGQAAATSRSTVTPAAPEPAPAEPEQPAYVEPVDYHALPCVIGLLASLERLDATRRQLLELASQPDSPRLAEALLGYRAGIREVRQRYRDVQLKLAPEELEDLVQELYHVRTAHPALEFRPVILTEALE